MHAAQVLGVQLNRRQRVLDLVRHLACHLGPCFKPVGTFELRPLALEVTPDLPVSAPASAVIVWTGPLTARVVEDRHLYEVMRPAAEGATLIRLEGTGRLLMEQVVA